MAYNETVVRAARERLEKRRRDAESAATALQNKMCEQYPRLKDIQREKAASIPELTRAILDKIPPPRRIFASATCSCRRRWRPYSVWRGATAIISSPNTPV